MELFDRSEYLACDVQAPLDLDIDPGRLERWAAPQIVAQIPGQTKMEGFAMTCTMTEGIARSQYSDPAVLLDVAKTELHKHTEYGADYSRAIVAALDTAADAVRLDYPEIALEALDAAYDIARSMSADQT